MSRRTLQRRFTITLTERQARVLAARASALEAFERAIAPGIDGYEIAGMRPEDVLRNLITMQIERWERHHSEIRQRARETT